MAKTTLNTEGESSAHALIRAGHYDMASPWSFSAEDGNALLGPGGDDWDKFGRWHLGEDASEPRETKAHWKYPYGKGGKVYRRALAAIRSRASQESDTTVFDAAGRLMTAMDEEEKKKESTMSLSSILRSRFGHFATLAPLAATAPAAAAAEGGDDEAKRAAAAKKAEEDEEAKRKAEEDARRAKRSRRARRARGDKGDKGDKGDQGDKGDKGDDADDDDAADDDEDAEDEEEMKRAAAAGHAFALDAAFRTGARAQRRRCAAIFESPAAAANPVLAMSLAFETTMTAGSAIAVLEKTPAPARAGGLHQRMAESGAGAVRIPASAPGAPSGPQALAASWDNALKDFGPPRRAA